MHIAMIGGLERNEAAYKRLALLAGCSLEFHSGHTAGRGSAVLESLIDRAEFVIVVTDLNSHGAVQQARRHVRERGLPSLLARRMSLSQFSVLLDAIRKKPTEANARAAG